MDNTMREHTVKTIAGAMNGVSRDICERAIKNFYKADPEYGDGISKLLGFPSVKSRL